MTTSCRRVFKKLQLLKSGTSWAQCFASFSDSKSGDKNIGQWEVPDLPNPVRNTEKELLDNLRNSRLQGHERGPFDGRFFTKKFGITKEVYSWLHWDININDTEELMSLLKKKNFQQRKEDQKYLPERVKVLGPELAAAHFVVARGGAVKFVGHDFWIRKDNRGQFSLPRKYVENLFVEGVDVSSTKLTYVAFDNFEELSQLRYLKLKDCEFIDDWCLARMQRLKHCLEFLDITDCPNITDCGLASLHCLSKLQGLQLSNLKSVKYIGLVSILLEEALPELTIIGVSDEQLKPPESKNRGERKLVQALLGIMDKEEDDCIGLELEFLGTYSHDGVQRYPRNIRRVE